MTGFNRLGNIGNQYQQIDKFKRVLTVCSAGMLRSPTAAYVLSMPPYCHNTRAAGVSEEYALVVVDEVLVAWADEIVFMEDEHRDQFTEKFSCTGKDVVILDIPDNFRYRDPKLMDLIREKYDAAVKGDNDD